MDCESKWVEAKSLPTNDINVGMGFINKHILNLYRSLRAIISDDQQTQFYNQLFKAVF